MSKNYSKYSKCANLRKNKKKTHIINQEGLTVNEQFEYNICLRSLAPFYIITKGSHTKVVRPLRPYHPRA